MKFKKITANNIIYAVAVLLLINITACKKLSSYDYPSSVGTAYDILKNDNNFFGIRQIEAAQLNVHHFLVHQIQFQPCTARKHAGINFQLKMGSKYLCNTVYANALPCKV